MTAGDPPEMEATAGQPKRTRSCVLARLPGALALATILYVVWILLPRPHPSHAICLSNAKNIALAFQMYLADNDDRFLPADGWCDGIREYVKNRDVFRCPQAEGPDGGFAYNAALDGVSVASLSNRAGTVLVFESDRGWNAFGGRELLPDEPRHSWGEEQGDNYSFADGSARWLKRKQSPDGTWARVPDAAVIWELGAEEKEPRA